MYKVYGVTRENVHLVQKKLEEERIINWNHSLDTILEDSILSVMNRVHKDNIKFIVEVSDDLDIGLEADDEIYSIEEFVKEKLFEEYGEFDKETIPF